MVELTAYCYQEFVEQLHFSNFHVSCNKFSEFKIFIKIQNGNSTSVVQGINLALIVTFNEAFCALWFSINHWRAMTAVSEH